MILANTRSHDALWISGTIYETLCSQPPSLFSFENRLDKFWRRQSLKFDFEASMKLLHPSEATCEADIELDQDLGRGVRSN